MKDYSKILMRPSDSFLTKIFARSLSVKISPWLAEKTEITPLQVTLCGLLIGLVAAWVGSHTEWALCILAALLMEMSHILDCVDGELARLTDRGSPFAASMDPITDRIKDIAVVYASFFQASQAHTLNLSAVELSGIAFFAIGIWMFYIYVVDAYLNPARKVKTRSDPNSELQHIYFGMYDVFIYGSIVLWAFNRFEYFMFVILGVAITASMIQVIRLKLVYSSTS